MYAVRVVKNVNIYGVRKGSKAAVPVYRYFFTGAPVKFTGGPLKITGAPLYFTGAPVDCLIYRCTGRI